MKKIILSIAWLTSVNTNFAKDRLKGNEISINAFRNPSIGLEYRHNHISAHGGYYVTNFKPNVTTEFMKAGVTYWFLPVNDRVIPSSFYSSFSLAAGTSREYKGNLAFITEIGFRWMVVAGLNLRIGVAALSAAGHDVEINPTPGISYSFFFH